jgi:outer membrane protein, heavy metal efflux system
MRVFNIILVLTGLFFASSVFAELTLVEAQKQAYELDSNLQYLYRQDSMSGLKIQHSGRFSNPEVAVELDNLGNNRLIDLDGPSYSVRLSQAVPLSNKRSLRVALAEAKKNTNLLAIEQRQAYLNAEVRLCLAEWSVAEQRSKLAVDDFDIAQSQARLIQEKLMAGRVVQSDVERAQALASEANQKVAVYRSAAVQRKALCSLIVGSLDHEPITLPTTIPTTSATTHSPSLSQRQALFAEQEANIGYRLANTERLPEMTLSIGTRRYQQTGDVVLLAGVSMPIPLFNQNQVARADAKNELENANRLVAVQQKRSAILLENAKQRLQSHQQLLTMMDQRVIPAAQESLRIAQLAYQSGKTGLLEWIDARRVWRESRERRLDIWLNIQHAIAEIERETPPSTPFLGQSS